jgi:hypothetical protein
MSGLLGSIFSFGDDLKKRARGLLHDPLGHANATVGEFNDKAQAAARGLLAGKGGMESVDALGAGPHALGGLLGAIKVFHGSPHVFNKADSSKIGTGEGAQAYGHGLYWAENKDVAGTYAEAMSPMPKLSKNGDRLIANSYAEMLAEARALGAGSIDKAIERQTERLSRAPKNGSGVGVLEETGRPLEEEGLILGALQKFKAEGYGIEAPGNLYEANLRWPDAAREAKDPLGPQHFLDWDKPLNQQAPAVRQSISAMAEQRGMGAGWGDKNYGAQDFLRALQSWDPQAKAVRSTPAASEASGMLRQAGIPGIAYMDAGSRAAGQGTRNYVTFDDALVELLSRNGQPLLGR